MSALPRGSLRRAALCVAVAVSALFGAVRPAAAAPDEIEVYQSDLQRPGRFGLGLNVNYVPDGDRSSAWPGAEPSQGALRLTPELAYGLTDNIELGVLTAGSVNRSGDAAIGTFAVRARYIDRRGDGAWYWGGNLELGRASHRFEEQPWTGELRLIGGVDAGRWTFAVNPTLNWSLGGGEPATLDVAGKASYRVWDSLALGVESYNELGMVARPGHLQDQEQVLYATVDAKLGKAALNLGLGRGLTGVSDRWVLKAVVDFDFR